MTSVDACAQSQVDMWMAERLGGLGASYHLSFGFAICGPLDVDLLAYAVRALLRRHPILLTCFPDHDGAPRPAPVPEDAWRLEVVPGPVAADAVVRARVSEPFDLARGPLVRTCLVPTGPESHLLLFVCHHLVFDGTSRDVVARDLAALYRAAVTGGEADLPPLPTYADHLRREREQAARSGTDLPEGWRAAAALATDPARLSDALPLAGGTPDPDAAPRAAEAVDFALPGELRAGLDALAAAVRVTPFTALLASFTVLLDKYGRAAGTAAPVIAVPAGTRPAGFADCVGPYVNELPFRSPPRPDGSFREHLATTGRRLRELLALRRVPLGELRRRAGDRRAAAPDRPGPAVVFGYRRAAGVPGLGPELTVEYRRSLPNHATRAEVEVQLTDDGDGLTGRLSVDRARFDVGFAERLLADWRGLLTQLVAHPDRPLAEVCLLSGRQRRTVLADWNDTGVARAATTLPARFEARVAATPEAVALVVDGPPGTPTVSYAELNRRANRLAHRLRGLGVGPETLVAVCVERSADLMVALLGTLKAGAAYVPLDPEYPPERLRFMLRDCGAPVLLTQRRLRGLLDPPSAVVPLDDPAELAGQPDTDPPPTATPASPAYAIYTSGSTGAPKAAVLPHAAIDNRLAWMQEHYRLRADDRVLHKTPVGFDVSGWELFWPLLTGARLVLARPGGHRDGAYLVDLVNRQSVTTIHFVPPMLEAFLDQPGVATCRSLRRVICSGEELPARLVDRFAGCLDAELHNLYGPTEAAIDVTAWRCESPAGDRVPIGHPIANTRLHILDPDLQPVPVGVAGELYIGGVGLARGYLGRPALTAERFVPDPVAGAGARLYRTGDLACYRADGAIVFLGRLDHQVKIRGHRVEPAEVEAALAAQPGVGAAAVLARENPDRGPGERRLVGYVVAAPPGPAPDPDALVKALRDRLPDYLVPAAVVVLDALPLTPNGKLDRRALPDPPPTVPDYTAPRSDSERIVAEVWSDLFGLPRIGVDDDFFALGGHSLLATRTVARLRAAAGVELPMRTVFDHPTVGALAAAVEQASRR